MHILKNFRTFVATNPKRTIMDENKNMSRREFLRRMGVGAGSAMAIMALEPLNVIAKEKADKPVDNRMT